MNYELELNGRGITFACRKCAKWVADFVTTIYSWFLTRTKMSSYTICVTTPLSFSVTIRVLICDILVLTAASIKMTDFWNIVPCSLVGDRRFRDAYCVHHPEISHSYYIFHCLIIKWNNQACINPWRQVAMAPKMFMTEPRIFCI